MVDDLPGSKHDICKRACLPISRRDVTVLQSILPARQDYVIAIGLSTLQETLYKEFLGLLMPKDADEEDQAKPSYRRILQDFVALRSVWTHPKLLTMPKKYAAKKKVRPVTSLLRIYPHDSSDEVIL